MPKEKHKQNEDCELCRRRRFAGARLRRLRKQRGLSMAQVAVLVGVSERLVSTWERGQGLPGLCAAFYLAHALNRQVIDLFFPIHDYARQEVDYDKARLCLTRPDNS